MTRAQLAKIDSMKVRKDPKLFSLFRTYVTEDARFIYSSGKLPQGCFGCSFSSLFTKWKNYINSTFQNKNSMANSDKKMILKNKAFKAYFKGKLLTNDSTDVDWKAWVNYPADKKKVSERKNLFEEVKAETKKDNE